MNVGYMYTTTVKTIKIPDGKTGLKIAAPIPIWLMSELVFFSIVVKVEAFVISFLAMLLFIVIFIVAEKLREIGYELICLFNGVDNNIKAIISLDKIVELKGIEAKIK